MSKDSATEPDSNPVSGALSGYRVLDMTHVLAGPFCCYQLGMLGAEVIKIEPPGCFDMMRSEGPVNALAEQNMGLHYQAQNAGKLSLTLDVACKAGREVFTRLLSTADVLVTNYRRPSQNKLGLDPASIRSINPRLLTCSITGFGQTGPKADEPAYDNVIQAFSGLMAATGSVDAAPVKVGPPVLDYGTGVQAALAVTAALLHRERTGTVSHLDVAMLDAALMLMTSSVTEAVFTGSPPVPHGNSSPTRAGYGCYETTDGLLMIGAFTCKQNARLWRALGDELTAAAVESLTPLTLDLRYLEDRERLQTRLREKSAIEWEEQLNLAGVPAAKVRTLDEALAHQQIASRSVVMRTDAGNNADQPACFATTSWESDTGSASISSTPPRAGQDNDKIISALGYSEGDIRHLYESGII